MKYTHFFLFAALSALTLSCNKEMGANQPAAADGITEITASFVDGQTKTVLGSDGTSILWSPNDEISVFYNGDGVKFTSINSTPKDRTIFRSSYSLIYGGAETSSEPYIYGAYPYSSSNAQEGELITLTVPSSQTAVEGSFGRGAYPSVGRSKTTDIAFYNVCGGMRFTLCQSGIRKIVLTGNNYETLAGKVKVQFDENDKPKVSAIVTGEKSITLSAPDGGEFQTGKWYYISVLPTTFSKSGFSLEFIKRTDESERGSKTITSTVEVKRSIFGSIENIDSNVSFKVGVASLSISPADVRVAPMSAAQLSLTVLPSEASYEWIKWSSSDKTIATVDEDGMVVGKKDGKCTITATSDNGKTASCTICVSQIQELIDLGLSVKWRSVNIGAYFPEENGRYFAWGDVVGQTWDGSSWSGDGFSTYPSYELDVNNNLKPEFDAAHVLLGGSWRMPTKAEQDELIDNCTSSWTSNYNGTGVAGRIFTSKKEGYTDKSIFLPAAGYSFDSGLSTAGSRGTYWSSTFHHDDYAWFLYFYSDYVHTLRDYRSGGFSVRPVSE